MPRAARPPWPSCPENARPRYRDVDRLRPLGRDVEARTAGAKSAWTIIPIEGLSKQHGGYHEADEPSPDHVAPSQSERCGVIPHGGLPWSCMEFGFHDRSPGDNDNVRHHSSRLIVIALLSGVGHSLDRSPGAFIPESLGIQSGVYGRSVMPRRPFFLPANISAASRS